MTPAHYDTTWILKSTVGHFQVNWLLLYFPQFVKEEKTNTEKVFFVKRSN